MAKVMKQKQETTEYLKYSPAELEELANLLQEKKEKLTTQIETLKSNSLSYSTDNKSELKKPGSGVCTDVIEANDALIARYTDDLEYINKMAHRLIQYKTIPCISCENPVEPARLKAVLTAKTCTKCMGK